MVGHFGGGVTEENEPSATSFGENSSASSASIMAGPQTTTTDHLPTFGGAVEPQPVPTAPTATNNRKMRDMMVIDEICNMIRYGCQEQEVVRLINQYQINEAQLSNMQWSQENKFQ